MTKHLDSVQKAQSNKIGNKGLKALLSSSALVAASMVALSSPAMAAGSWSGLAQTSGSFTTDTPSATQTDITLNTMNAVGTGDLDIAAGDVVNLHMNPSGRFVAIDNEADPAYLLGQLNADGAVWVLDRDGVFFGADAQINVGSIVASTGELTNMAAFMGGANPILSNFGAGTVRNEGIINVADAGLAALVAPTVVNNGVINARMGRVALVGANGDTEVTINTIDPYGDGLFELAVGTTAGSVKVFNNGDINAEDGGVVQIETATLSGLVDGLINMKGVTNVSSVTVDGGKIVLGGGEDGRVNVVGELDASGVNGGTVEISAKGGELRDGSEINADSNAGGDAGTIDIAVDEYLAANGSVHAIGAAGTGFIRTAAGADINFTPTASILTTGEWVAETQNFTIGAMRAALLENQLAVGDATLRTTSHHIRLEDLIAWTSDNTLTLDAFRDVEFKTNGGVEAINGGALVVIAGDDIRMRAGNVGAITHGGTIDMKADDEFTLVDGTVNANGGDIVIENGDSFAALANSIQTSGTGTIALYQNKDSNGDVTIVTPKIQNAIDAINNTGTGTNTVYVGAGTWNESVQADHANLLLSGANAGLAGTDGTRGAESIITPNSPGFVVSADNVTVDGFMITGADNGIEVGAVDNAQIINNVISNNSLSGIYVDQATNSVIDQNLITNSGWDGIKVNGGDNLTVSNNSVLSSQRAGIYAQNLSNSAIANNIVDGTNQYRGISLVNGGNLAVTGNNVSHTALDGIIANAVLSLTVANNVVSEVGANGIKILNNDGATVSGNTISDSLLDGVHVEGGYSVNILNNDISNSGDDGIDVTGNDLVRILNNTIRHSTSDGIAVAQSYNTGATMASFAIGVNNNDVRYSGANGITVNDFSQAMIGNNNVRHSGSNGIHADGQGAAFITLVDNDVRHADASGIYSTNTSSVLLRDNSVRQVGLDGIQVDAGQWLMIKGNMVRNADHYGISVDGGQGLILAENDIKHTGSHGIGLVDVLSATVTNNIIDDASGAGIHADQNSGNRGDWIEIARNDITNTGGDGIYAWNSDQMLVQDNNVENAGYVGINIGRFVDATITQNTIDTTDHKAIYADGYNDMGLGNSLTVTENTITNAGNMGAYIAYTDNVFVSDNLIDGTGHDGVYLEYTGVSDIADNTIIHTSGDGIYVTASQTTTIANNFIGTDELATDYGVFNIGEDGIHIVDTDNSYIGDNVIRETGENGIKVQNSDGTTIEGNDIQNVGLNGIYVNPSDSIKIFDNIISTTGADGIHVAGGYDVRIRGNDIRHTGDDGIDVSDNDFVRIKENIVRDTADNGIVVSNAFNAADTAIVVANNDVRSIGDAGIQLNGFSDARIVDNIVRNSVNDGIDVNGDPHNMATHVRIARNDVRNAGDSGINVMDVLNSVIVDNTTYNVGTGIYVDQSNGNRGDFVKIARNDVKNTGGDAIYSWNSDEMLIRNNDVTNAGYIGINIGRFVDATIANNTIDMTDHKAIYADGYNDSGLGNSLTVLNNTVTNAGDMGAYIAYTDNVFVTGNMIDSTGNDGVYLEYTGVSDIADNLISNIDGDGVSVVDSAYTTIANNTITNADNGIFIDNVAGYNHGAGLGIILPRDHVIIDGNWIESSKNNGVSVTDSGLVTVNGNTVVIAGNNGVYVGGSRMATVTNNYVGTDEFSTDFGAFNIGGNGIFVENTSQSFIDSNIVRQAAANGIKVENADETTISLNDIDQIGESGIAVGGIGYGLIANNLVSNSPLNGLYAFGPDNGTIVVSGNILTANDIGAQFESGTIDLTGETNQFIDGRVGLRFASYDLGGGSYASMALVDDDGAGGFGGTIGAQYFDGQSEYFVELDNEAFFAPGNPTVLNALNSTYVTPFGDLTPIDTAGVLNQDEFDYLEDMFFHYTDRNDLGLFFFGYVPEIDQEDIYNTFAAFAGTPAGLSVTVTGLPTLPGGEAFNFASLAPFAGEEMTPEMLASITPAAGGGETDPNIVAAFLSGIEPAAGGEDEACWGDAMADAGTGMVVNYSFGSGTDEILNDASRCQTSF